MNPNTDSPVLPFLPFSRPEFGPEEEEAVLRVLRSGWLTTGPEVRAFEAEFAAYVGSPQALAVNSATAGLHLALEALGIGPGKTVAVPSLTFTASAEVVRYLGAQVVLIDSAPDHPNLDLEALEALCRRQTIDAVVAVHFAGEPVDGAALRALKARCGFALVEDAAHAFPVRDRATGLWAGTLGDIGVYSFYANKTITTGEGGMIVTARDDLAARMRVMRLHGIDRDAFARFQSKGPAWRYDVVAPGYKYNMPDLAGALGRVQLAKAEALLERRREQAGWYDRHLAPLGWLRRPALSPHHAWHLYWVRVPESWRDALIQGLAEAGIGTSVHYTPLHGLSYWRDLLGQGPDTLPWAQRLGAQALSLPLFPSLSEADVARIAAALGRLGEALHGR